MQNVRRILGHVGYILVLKAWILLYWVCLNDILSLMIRQMFSNVIYKIHCYIYYLMPSFCLKVIDMHLHINDLYAFLCWWSKFLAQTNVSSAHTLTAVMGHTSLLSCPHHTAFCSSSRPAVAVKFVLSYSTICGYTTFNSNTLDLDLNIEYKNADLFAFASSHLYTTLSTHIVIYCMLLLGLKNSYQ